MRNGKRMRMPAALLRGVLAAVGMTLAAMALLTLAVWRLDMSDGMLVMINQLIKVSSVAMGTYMAVGRGGESGFLTGAAIGTVYAAAGCGLYAALGGAMGISAALGEWTVCAAAGAFTGAVAANLPAVRRV